MTPLTRSKHLSRRRLLRLAGLFAPMALGACAAEQQVASASTPEPAPTPAVTYAAVAAVQPQPPATATPATVLSRPIKVNTEVTEATAAPTLVPVAVPTATTPTAPALHSLMIEAQRRQAYPGSDIVIEQRLSPGPNYDRAVVSYRSEGLKIFALMTFPRGEKPAAGWPAIVFNHGYIPPRQYRTTERYVAYVDNLARSGYIVFKSDYRGHGDSEGEPRSYGYPDYTTDVLNALASVRQFENADPNRLAMWGHSMGGYLTLRAMVIAGDIKAGSIWAGVVGSYAEVANMWFNRGADAGGAPGDSRHWREALYVEYGTPKANPVFWNAISATSYLADLSGPLQLHHGTGDTHVPVEMSRNLVVRAKDAGRVVDYVEYDGDNHNLSVNFTSAMRATIDMFKSHV